jgi:hypothetical protein
VEEAFAGPGAELEGEEAELGDKSVFHRSIHTCVCSAYNREAEEGRDGKQPVGAISRELLIPRRWVSPQGIVTRKQCHDGYFSVLAGAVGGYSFGWKRDEERSTDTQPGIKAS